MISRIFNGTPLFVRFLLGYLLILLPLYCRLLLGSRMYIDGDTVGFSYVAIKALNPFSISSLLSDPFSGRGFPWIFSYGTMDPIVHFMRLIFNEFQTLAWICYIYFSLGGLLFAIFLKNRGNSTLSSFVGGLVFSLSFFWVGDGDYSFPFLLPLFASILILIQGCFRHLFRNGILITLMVAYGWVAGHFNFVPLILVGCGIFAVLQTFENKKPNKRRVMIIAYIFACFLLGTFLGMARLLPALANLQFSERAGGLSAEVASTVTLNISSLITAFFPYMVLPSLNGSDDVDVGDTSNTTTTITGPKGNSVSKTTSSSGNGNSTCSSCNDKKQCPPCPSCARCPEPSFDCKKVPSYKQGSSNAYLPRPVLSDFSTFGM